MRSLGILILAASIGLIGVIVWQGPAWLQGPTLLPASTATLPVKPIVSKEKGRVRERVAKKPTHQPAAEEFSSPPDLSSPTTVVPHPLSVPDPEKMEIGATRSELRERFGVPTFAVSSVRDGNLVERYCYAKPDHATLVIATLLEGKLVSAQTVLWQPKQISAVPSAQ
jgi:hypothetical protein